MLDDNDETNFVQYWIDNCIYDSFEELKINLKNRVFVALLSKEKYADVKENFGLDSSSKLFCFCSSKSSLYLELKGKLDDYFKRIEELKSLENLMVFVTSFYESELVLLPDFSINFENYKANKYKKSYIPVAILSNHSIALKVAKFYESLSGDYKLVKYSSNGDERKIEEIRKVL